MKALEDSTSLQVWLPKDRVPPSEFDSWLLSSCVPTSLILLTQAGISPGLVRMSVGITGVHHTNCLLWSSVYRRSCALQPCGFLAAAFTIRALCTFWRLHAGSYEQRLTQLLQTMKHFSPDVGETRS